MSKKKKEDMFAWNDAIRKMSSSNKHVGDDELGIGDYCWYQWAEDGDWFIGKVEYNAIYDIRDCIEHPMEILNKVIKIHKPD